MKKGFVGIMFLSLILSSCGGQSAPRPYSRNTYTVLWQNFNGVILESDTNLSEGSWPTYNGPTPQRESDDYYNYIWDRWEPNLSYVYSDITYTAVFSKILKDGIYTVRFETNGGSLIDPVMVKRGEALSKPDNPTKDGYLFDGWYSEESYITEYDFSKPINSSFTLYAKWIDAHAKANQLDTPIVNVDYDEYKFFWDYVPNATKYYYVIEKSGVVYRDDYTTNNYTYLFYYEALEPDLYTFKVKSIGDGFNYRSSDYAIITCPYKLLSSVANIWFNEINNILFWGSVENATSYELTIDELTTVSTTENHYDFTGLYAGKHQVTITAMKDGWVSSSKNYSFTIVRLSAPTNLIVSLSEDLSEYIITWDEVRMGNDYVDTYLIYINDIKKDSINKTQYTINCDSPDFINERLTMSVVAFDSYSDYLASTKSDEISLGLNDLSVLSQDSSMGSASIVSGSGYSLENITVSAIPKSNYVFSGWYSNNALISTDDVYSFDMPTHNYNLEARFITKEQAQYYGIIPCISEESMTISYGLYPQTNINNWYLIDSLNALTKPESNGWYLYDGNYYAKVQAKPYSSTRFSNGEYIISGETYWFKCEPIIWNILSNNNNEYYAVSSLLLDAMCFYNSESQRIVDDSTIYANNYEYSDIRSWLNNNFFNTAFALKNSHILTTTVINSASTTSNENNIYACNNTNDKVFLPSYQDYINEGYGFSDRYDRRCRCSDYAMATGIYSKSYGDDVYCWTRSPSNVQSSNVMVIRPDGFFEDLNVTYTIFGVRPAITIKVT